MQKLKTVESKVMQILHDNVSARNSDNKLILLYMKKYFNLYLFEDAILKTPFESITRARRKIQARGMYESDKQIKAARREKTWEYKEYNYGEVK